MATTRLRLAGVWRELDEIQWTGMFTPEEFAALRAVIQPKLDDFPEARLVEAGDDEVIDAWEMDAVVDAEETADGQGALDAVALTDVALEAEAVVVGPNDEILDAVPI